MNPLLAKPAADKVRAQVRNDVEEFKSRYGRAPRLAVVLVGSNPASVIYTRRKGEAALELGMEHETINFPETATPDEVKGAIERLNFDTRVDGILVQRPLPAGFIEEEVLHWVAPEKDVDCFHPENVGRLTLGLPGFAPCTPAGVMVLLEHYGIQTAGKLACVIGRSSIVGKPMASLLLKADATVLQCHSRTKDLKSVARQADLLIVAAGKAGLVGADYVKPGAVVVDVGIHRTAEGKVVGDVRYDEVAKVASAVTPVPGGVGPMTIAILLKNTIDGANRRLVREAAARRSS